MLLNSKEKQALKAKAHHIKPVIIMGAKGITEALLAEIDRALTDHELIKIKVPGQDKQQRKATLSHICEQTKAEHIQLIGNIGIIYRKKPE